MSDVHEKEFTCVECGQHVVVFDWPLGSKAPLLCALCLHLPGWFRDPRLSQVFGAPREPEQD